MRTIYTGLYITLYALPLRILSLILFPLPAFQTRLKFEKKNSIEPLSISFREQQLKADYCFEFSSEGEYQQVASLIHDALEDSKKLELIFFSPSVEKTIIELSQKYPAQVRYLRYPLLKRGLSQWITASTLILVRYDLFPELLLWSMKPGNQLKMVWVSFKRERVKKKPMSFFKRLFLSNSKSIIYASRADQDMGSALGFKGSFYDFRIEQIRRRMLNRLEKFQEIFPLYNELKSKLEEYPRSKRIIVGNAWPSDLTILSNIPDDYLVVIVPHQLKPEIIQAFKDGMIKLGREITELSNQVASFSGNTFLINKKGILCELYADFGKAYVGGGLETSVHSILEPLVAGSESISCGPIHHRSTEYDVAESLGRMTEVKNSEDFLLWLQQSSNPDFNHSGLEGIFNKYSEYRKEVISC